MNDLTLIAEDGSRADVAPGASHALTCERGIVRIVMGPARYQLEYEKSANGELLAPHSIRIAPVLD